MYWLDYKMAELCHGPQEAQSLMYAETVSSLVGVPMGDPDPYLGLSGIGPTPST